MASLQEYAQKIASAALPMETIHYGPWEGSMRSVSADLVPREFIAGGADFLYKPRYGSWKRRLGQTIQFDTITSNHETTGALPAKWTSRCRWMEEFVSDSVTNGIPTVAALLTRETVAAGLDDGRFSNLWLRDQVNSLNYTLGSEYSALSYPGPGSTQTFRYVPLWYDSGDGGLTRGTTEFARRFFVCGSRRFGNIGNWWYFPSVLGTPARWDGRFVVGSILGDASLPSGTDAQGSWFNSDAGATLHTYVNEAVPDNAKYIYTPCNAGAGQTSCQLTLPVPSPLPSASTTHKLQVRYRRTGTGGIGAPTGPGLDVHIYKNNIAITGSLISIAEPGITTDWIDTEVTLSGAQITALGDYTGLEIYANWTGTGADAGSQMQIAWCRLYYGSTSIASQTATASHLIPSGPIPPCHAGTITATSAVTAAYTYPAVTVASGTWLNNGGGAATFDRIDDTVGSTNDADFIRITNANDECSFRLATPAVTPVAGDTVTIRWRTYGTVVSAPNIIQMRFRQGAATLIVGQDVSFPYSTTAVTYGTALSAAQLALVTDWTDVRIAFIATSLSAFDSVTVTQAYLEVLPASATSEGGWKGHDRFYRAVAYRFEDGSVWAPTTPRAPNDLVSSGLDLVTVDVSNPDTAYTKITHTNLPVPPASVKSLLLLRSNKIDSTVDDNLQISPFDLKIIDEVDAGTTTYDDYFGDDLSLTLDAEAAFVRFDHIMSPRARYMAGGDMRMMHAYGGLNPCAIVIAPVGATTDYDRNAADTASAMYASPAFYMRVLIDGSTDKLDLIKSDGTTNTTTSFAFATYNTLQKLVDAINATSVAINSMQWRAQICPGASPDAIPATALTPNARTLTGCDIATNTISRGAGGLSKVGVGTLVSHANYATGTYVTGITSDSVLTVSANASGSATGQSITFYSELGDTPTAATANLGYQRVIGNCLPGFIYFNKTYLNSFPLQKSTAWMTTASPGSVKSAPNCFSSKESCRHQPPLDPGIATGIVAVDQGFVLFWAKKRGAVRNTRDSGSGRDEDYRLYMLNDSSGVPAWNTIVGGNRFAMGIAPEGVIVCDLFNERLISKAIYVHTTSDSDFVFNVGSGVGDFALAYYHEINSASKDTDEAAFTARIMRSAIWINHAAADAAGPTHPTRQIVYDFSSAGETTGLDALFRGPNRPWGWSLPLTRSLSSMAEVRRITGTVLYGWNEQNQGSTGDGRIDIFETSETDNGTAISTGSVQTPWESAGEKENISAQEIILDHLSPAGSTGSLVFHRSFSNDNYTMTPGTNSLVVLRELKMLATGARANANACYVDYKQASGSARELRKLSLRLKRVRRYR